MKAVAFDYVRPASVDEALRQLAADAGARVLAGGQTLIPMLAMRLARPTRLVDVARLGALSLIRATPKHVVVDAATTQPAAGRDAVVLARLALGMGYAQIIEAIALAADRLGGANRPPGAR